MRTETTYTVTCSTGRLYIVATSPSAAAKKARAALKAAAPLMGGRKHLTGSVRKSRSDRGVKRGPRA